MTNAFYVPESAMAIVAHPDDIEFGCAGSSCALGRGRCAHFVCAVHQR